MKTMNVSKQMVWWQTASNLEVWECVMLKDVKKDVTPLAYASEQIGRSTGKSIFIYEAGDGGGWEYRRKEAMKKAEDISNGVGSFRN